jgi:hypothetical protein
MKRRSLKARLGGPITPFAMATCLSLGLFGYAAWLTSIVFCAQANMRPLLVASAVFFPVGIVHGIGVWFGGW